MKLCSGCPLQPLAWAASQGHVKTTPATSSHACLHPHPLNQHCWQQRQGKSISIKFPDDIELKSQAHGSQGRQAGMRFQGAGLGPHSCRASGGGGGGWGGDGGSEQEQAPRWAGFPPIPPVVDDCYVQNPCQIIVTIFSALTGS